jgi:hypothetical protein
LVKVVLTGPFFTLEKNNTKTSCTAFKILPPYMLPHDANLATAKAFFDDIKKIKNLSNDVPPSLSWWVISEVEEEIIKWNQAHQVPVSKVTTPSKGSTSGKQEEEKTHVVADSTNAAKPAPTTTEVPEVSVEQQLE